MKRAALYAAASALVIISACSTSPSDSSSQSSAVSSQSSSPPSITSPAPTPLAPTSATTTAPRSTAPNGRLVLAPPATPQATAAELVDADRGLRRAGASAADLADWGHRQQLAYRRLAARPEWDSAVLDAVPIGFRSSVEDNLNARRAFFEIGSGFVATKVPAWEIIAPEPADQLLSYYKEAERATGIGWHYLAAINFVETGFGRIRGLSSAGAQGPMQFLPSTWNEAGIGRGDINSAHDAIQAAARYLVRRGGPADMRKALFGYNNHNAYVEGVSRYAELMRRDEVAFIGYYNWEIYYSTDRGSLWMPVGVYKEPLPILIDDYIAKAPWTLVR